MMMAASACQSGMTMMRRHPPRELQDATSGRIVGINSGFPDQVMSAGTSPAKSSGRRKSGPNAKTVHPKRSPDDAAEVRRRCPAAAASETESDCSEQQVKGAAVRKSSRVLARKLKQPTQASRLRPDSPSAEANDAPDVPAAKHSSAEEVRRKRDAAARTAGTAQKAAAAALTRPSEETESDDAVQRHHARVSEQGQAADLASDAQQGKGASAGTAGAAVVETRQTSAAARRPGKMRSLADLLGTAPEKSAASRPEQQPSESERGGMDKAAVSNGRVATHSTDAGAVNSGRSEPHANGGSARAGTVVEQPDSDDWTDAQVRLGYCVTVFIALYQARLTMCCTLLSLTQLCSAGMGAEDCTVPPQSDRQAVLDVGCG